MKPLVLSTARAFVLRSTPLAERDAIVSVFTDNFGLISLVAKRARSVEGKRTFIEPIHTLYLEFTFGKSELGSLKSSRIEVARLRLIQNIESLEAASMAMRWIRTLMPIQIAEVKVFQELEQLFDRLEQSINPNAVLSQFGFCFLSEMGYQIEFSRCTQCGAERPLQRAGIVLAEAGGLVCQDCRSRPSIQEFIVSGATLDKLSTTLDTWWSTETEEHVNLVKMIDGVIELRGRALQKYS